MLIDGPRVGAKRQPWAEVSERLRRNFQTEALPEHLATELTEQYPRLARLDNSRPASLDYRLC